jgi:hypothetical protein
MSLMTTKNIHYRGCTIMRREYNQRFYNTSHRGGAAWCSHDVVTWEASDEEGNWLSSIRCRPLMRDCKRAIDKHIKRQEERVGKIDCPSCTGVRPRYDCRVCKNKRVVEEATAGGHVLYFGNEKETDNDK